MRLVIEMIGVDIACFEFFNFDLRVSDGVYDSDSTI